MKQLTELLPLHSSFVTGHTEGLRDELRDAGQACIGRTLLAIHCAVYFVGGEQQHPDNETEVELDPGASVVTIEAPRTSPGGQGDTDQSATAVDSKAEGNEKPKPKSEPLPQ